MILHDEYCIINFPTHFSFAKFIFKKNKKTKKNIPFDNVVVVSFCVLYLLPFLYQIFVKCLLNQYKQTRKLIKVQRDICSYTVQLDSCTGA